MSLNIDKYTAKSDYNIAVKDACVIIRNQQTGSLRVRNACEFKENLAKLKKLIKDQVHVQDPKKGNGDKIFTIIFYGQKNLAKSHITEEKEKQDDLSLDRNSEENDEDAGCSSAAPVAKRFVSSTSVPRLNRNVNNSTSNFSYNNTSELISLMNSIRDDQIRTQQFLKDFVKDNEVMKQKLDDIVNKQNKDRKKVSYSEGAELIQFCTAEVARMRTEKNFELRLKEIAWDSLDLAKKDKDNILAELRWERKVSRMISNVGKILFGPLLLTHILGRYGRRERSRRETERPHTFNIDQEERLREVLRVFGDLFITDKVWKTIVQHHINQKGRDVKKSRKRSNESDDETSLSSSDEVPHRFEDREKSKVKRNKTTTSLGADNENDDDVTRIVTIPSSQKVNLHSVTEKIDVDKYQDLENDENVFLNDTIDDSLDKILNGEISESS